MSWTTVVDLFFVLGAVSSAGFLLYGWWLCVVSTKAELLLALDENDGHVADRQHAKVTALQSSIAVGLVIAIVAAEPLALAGL